jgi:hypothetical protein
MLFGVGIVKNREIAELAGVALSTVARFKKKPGWPGEDDIEKMVAFIQSTKSRAGRKPKAQEEQRKAATDTDEITRLNLEYKRSQIEKNNTSTHDYQLRILKSYRTKMVKGCSESMSIIFKAIKALDLDHDQIKNIKEATQEAREHLKGVASE